MCSLYPRHTLIFPHFFDVPKAWHSYFLSQYVPICLRPPYKYWSFDTDSHFQQWCPCLYRSSDTPERSCWFIMICILFGDLFCVVRWGQGHMTSLSQWNTRVIPTKAVVPLVFSWPIHQPHSCLCSNATHSAAPSSSLCDWFFPFECTFCYWSHFSFASLSNILCPTNNIKFPKTKDFEPLLCFV